MDTFLCGYELIVLRTAVLKRQITGSGHSRIRAIAAATTTAAATANPTFAAAQNFAQWQRIIALAQELMSAATG